MRVDFIVGSSSVKECFALFPIPSCIFERLTSCVNVSLCQCFSLTFGVKVLASLVEFVGLVGQILIGWLDDCLQIVGNHLAHCRLFGIRIGVTFNLFQVVLLLFCEQIVLQHFLIVATAA